MTSVTGSTAMGAVVPAANRSSSESFGIFTPASGIAFFDRVAAKLIAQCGKQALPERVGLAGAETGEQRRGQDGQRNRPVDTFVECPASFAGVFYVPFDAREARILPQRPARQLKKPG